MLALLGAFALLASTAAAHPERQAFFPDPNKGAVPKYSGHNKKPLIVCKSDSKQRIRSPWSWHVKGSKFERRRSGQIATIKPGQAVPLTLSWRVPAGGSDPVEVRFDGGSLSLPR